LKFSKSHKFLIFLPDQINVPYLNLKVYKCDMEAPFNAF